MARPPRRYMDGKQSPQQALSRRTVIVAEDAGSVCGFIAGHLTHRFGCDGELEWINVAKEKRRTGVATALVRLLAEWFIAQKAVRICIDPGNAEARIFYERLGAVPLNKHWLVWDDVSIVLTSGS